MPRFGLHLGDTGEQAVVAVCVGPELCQLSGTRFTSCLGGKPLIVLASVFLGRCCICEARQNQLNSTVSRVVGSWVPVSK